MFELSVDQAESFRELTAEEVDQVSGGVFWLVPILVSAAAGAVATYLVKKATEGSSGSTGSGGATWVYIEGVGQIECAEGCSVDILPDGTVRIR